MTEACGFAPATRIQYVADGVQTHFGFPFQVMSAGDLLVFEGALPAAGYQVTGTGKEHGGQVVFLMPPPAGAAITIARRSAALRAGEFHDGAPFRASAVNAELDRLVQLIQETRAESCLAVRARLHEPALDLHLPGQDDRAGRLLGFDSAGRPMAYALADLPFAGEIGGHLATPLGATTARPLAEHLGARVDVRDFGAVGDGASDDTAAFQTALVEAASRGAPVYVPASAAPYVIAQTLILDGLAMIGDGRGSTLRLALADTGLLLDGDGPSLAGLRLQGPGAIAWPAEAVEVDLSGVTTGAVGIAPDALNATLTGVEIAACRTGVRVEGHLRAAVLCRLAHLVHGIELDAGADGSTTIDTTSFEACSRGVHVTEDALLPRLALAAPSFMRCGSGLRLDAPAIGWRVVGLVDGHFAHNTLEDLRLRPRQTLSLARCRLGGGGRRGGSAVELRADGAGAEAPTLVAEASRTAITRVRSAELSGSGLDLVAEGDLIVLAGDGDDIDEHWSALKATRAAIVDRIVTQTGGSALLELARAAGRPLPQADDAVRVVGRSTTATVDGIGAESDTASPRWLRAEPDCRVIASGNANPADQMELEGGNDGLHLIPGVAGEPAVLSGVELADGAVNGARTRMVVLQVAPNTAASFVPPTSQGIALVHSDGTGGDPAAASFTYRVGGGAHVTALGAASTVVFVQNMQLSGSGTAERITFSTHSDGKLYVQNTFAATFALRLFLIGASL